MKNNISIIGAFIFLSGCVGPDEKESFIISLNSIFGISVCSFFITRFLIFIINKMKNGRLSDFSELLIKQLFFIFVISVFVSFLIFRYNKDSMYVMLSFDPLTEWIGLQVFAILYIPVLLFLNIISVTIVMYKPKFKSFYLYSIVIFIISVSYFDLIINGSN